MGKCNIIFYTISYINNLGRGEHVLFLGIFTFFGISDTVLYDFPIYNVISSLYTVRDKELISPPLFRVLCVVCNYSFSFFGVSLSRCTFINFSKIIFLILFFSIHSFNLLFGFAKFRFQWRSSAKFHGVSVYTKFRDISKLNFPIEIWKWLQYDRQTNFMKFRKK